ncbi:DUF2690 domain-containing protein [Streptomyces griseosporeus]|uniref:DUF2690 domain-containing protein n=1 Tax=Streptomyces griseosporeus TaxID=1910 RepID=UPI0036FAB306
MPRWRALPDDLDPQVREFASQLRRLVDRSGLGIAALADRTGYSKTSWERYLNGRLLAPKGAVVALAEVTGTNPIHLTTMWELAERAWSRSEMRHDMTMEAIRISQARAALGEFGAAGAQPGGRTARRSGSATAVPGVAGPAGVAPTVPPQPTAPDADAREAREAREARAAARDVTDARPGTGADSAASPEDSGPNSWGIAGYQGPAPRGPLAGTGSGPAVGSGSGPGAGAPPVASGAYGAPPRVPRRADAGSGSGKRRLVMFLAGAVGVLVVIAGVFYVTGDGGGKDKAQDPTPSPSVSTNVKLPPGVKCSGATCTGKDAEAMGCSGDLVTTAKTATVGTTVVEVRYSKTCGTAWGRVTRAAQGDTVEVRAGTARQTGSITAAGDTIAYTPMVAVKDAGEATACATLASGRKGCTP